MVRKISSSDLRTQVKRVLNEVRYGQAQYIVEKLGELTAAIVSIEDFYLLQAASEKQAMGGRVFGRINIGVAPWRVLDGLPMLSDIQPPRIHSKSGKINEMVKNSPI